MREPRIERDDYGKILTTDPVQPSPPAKFPLAFKDIFGLPFTVEADHVIAIRTDAGPGSVLETYDRAERRFIRIQTPAGALPW